MWASCCNWFCVDGSPEEMQPPPAARAQAYSNPGYSSFPSPTASEQSCKACGMHFDSSSSKHICLDCKKNFCTSCSNQPEGGPLLCHLCQRFRATAFQREELIKMKVKDLRDYLALHEISTEFCREKEDLVFLILGQQPAITQEDQIRTNTFNTSAGEQQDFVSHPPTNLASPTSHDESSVSADPISSSEAQEHQQANGHVPPVMSPACATAAENAGEEAAAEDEIQSSDSEDNLVLGRKASLSDLTSVGDINALSVRQLKEILARNFVNYKGCCEKWELLERVTRLYREKDLQHLVLDTDNQTGGAGPPSAEDNLCRICMDAAIDCVLLECGHMVTCTKCGKRMSECPICRQYVIRAVHVFRT
ncbi:E3 ubiquitin-protein ligase rififylin isoform X1 [Haemorhous mexicanus]|uniref:E3 ubiquitin-protein ligase rififylin isoform X1 n=1 Tax=Haemorhous mexicanus TaxID=30427 RepID=UPI0028BD1E81|nr:E3 ubiquitin-protein ligase rififylin isoform X1 [Haemorhous mexicanus]XP_059721588.1 E3 ubiquitin-protein ligase rififylin isoform X1 [Haemorhous mexicanus]XP_059721589.1 E3 ubiquitin-protein ligase rififylin isoform X1 [Haemorhous mexicanus]XP_059721590.1 E3 ubiquitin-protein ligase rififylin isoform X1 [Haemorhous mexicanus]